MTTVNDTTHPKNAPCPRCERKVPRGQYGYKYAEYFCDPCGVKFQLIEKIKEK